MSHPVPQPDRRLFGIAGWSGAGKTTLIVQLLPEIARRGLSVSTIKHAHHGFDIDRPGKDSHAHRTAGAVEVVIASPERWALMHEVRGGGDWDIDTLVGRMSPVDLILVEGFKRAGHPKLEVHRPSQGKPLLCGDDPSIVAVASDIPMTGLAVPCLALDDVARIADLALAAVGLTAPR